MSSPIKRSYVELLAAQRGSDAAIEPPAAGGTGPTAAGATEPAPHPPARGQAGTLGAILVGSGRLRAEDAERIALSQRDSGLPFGEAGIRLGLLDEADLSYALARQYALPCLPADDASIAPEVIAAFRPADPRVEQIRQLRAQIMLREAEDGAPVRTLSIVSAEHGAGRSYVAANLAVVFAQLGHHTLLVDADLVRPRQHELFRIESRLGLSAILAARCGLEAIVPVAALPGLSVLPAGLSPPNPHDLLARPPLRTLLDRCARQFGVVIVDTPPWSAGSGTRMVAAAARAAVMLVRAGRSDAYLARTAGQELAAAGVRVLGLAFNQP